MCKEKKDDTTYKVDDRALQFLTEIEKENYVDENYELNIKTWEKIYHKEMDVFREWIAADKENILTELNQRIFAQDWSRYAYGNYSSWEMEAL